MTPPLPSSAALAKKHFNAGLNAFKRNNLIEAEAQLAQAISMDEKQAEYWVKLGLVWAKMGRHTESIEANTMALALEPTSADALYNLGICHIKMEREQAGLDYLQQSYRISPNNTLAEQLADIFYAKKDFMTAAYYLLHLYTALKSATKEPTLHKLATSLYHNGDLENSLKITIKLMQLSPDTAQYKNLLLDLYRRVTHSNFDRDAQKILVNLLKDDNTKFLFLRNPWISLFLLDATYKPLESFVNGSTSGINIKELSQILENDFLCLGIRRGIAIGIPIENILTNIRKFFLLNWKDAGTWPPGLLKFIASLAVGCWYNDFVYFISPEEKECLQEFKGHVTALLHSPTKPDSDTSVLLASLLACYVPLYEFCEDETQLLTTPRTKKYIEPLLTAQLRAPKIERELIPTIPPFSKIVDETSLSVQNMYASRPYPRWISTTVQSQHNTNSATQGLKILIAGCGTGHEPAIYANSMPGVHITAIDLSPPSIAYGKRMAIQLGIDKNIDFMHGDLMNVGDLHQSFDLVTSSGVLHHLKDPEKGLTAILKTLKPNGRLSISLYSKAARDYALNPALSYIREKGYTSSTDDIRQFRRDIMLMSPDNLATRCATAGDFFFLSECNDLLFHVQEHRYTPHMIWEMAERHNLIPIHISMTPDVLKLFKELFPDQSPLNPTLLEKFEDAHPKVFIEMYKIFFRRKENDEPSPLDSFIMSGLL